MESVKIVLLCVAAAVVYGVCQDQITVRVCVEYFTVGHPPIFGGTKNPTLLAFGWGVVATWWVGVLLGVPAALLARIGSRPKVGWRDLRWIVLLLMIVLALSATIAGFLGHAAAEFDRNYFPSAAVQQQPRYMAAAAAHGAAYAVGFLGGLLIWGWIWWKRGRGERRIFLAELERLRRENRESLERLRGDRAK